MTPKRIKKIREVLRLSQEDLATILSVTKNTIWRYEDGRGLPGEDVTVRLFSLESSLNDTSERKALKDLCNTPGGIAAMAAISALGSAIFSRSTSVDAAPVGYVEFLNYPAGKALFSFIEKTCRASSTKEPKRCPRLFAGVPKGADASAKGELNDPEITNSRPPQF
jgi:DNA-binding XRE family transcriptional regulator